MRFKHGIGVRVVFPVNLHMVYVDTPRRWKTAPASAYIRDWV